MAAARRMAAVACAAAAACAATMACRRATDAAACHGRRLKPVGFRRWRLARMAAGGAMMVVARVPITSFYRGLETFNGLATPLRWSDCLLLWLGGLATLHWGLLTLR